MSAADLSVVRSALSGLFAHLGTEADPSSLAAAAAVPRGGGGASFEEALEAEIGSASSGKRYTIKGRADVVLRGLRGGGSAVVELKAVGALKGEHLIQLAVYGWLLNQKDPAGTGSRRLVLLNLLTGESVEIKESPERLEEIVRKLLQIEEEKRASDKRRRRK